MKPFILIFGLLVYFSVTNARAEVLIYTGTVLQTELAVRTKPFVRKVFLVTDPTAKSVQLVTYAKVNGVKDQQSQAVRVGDYFGGTLAQGGPSYDIYTFLKNEKNLGIIQDSVFVRGLQKSVQVDSNMGVPVTAMRARTLKGSIRTLVAALGSSYIEQDVSVTLDTQRTIDANARSLSASAAFNELTALLSARGYN